MLYDVTCSKCYGVVTLTPYRRSMYHMVVVTIVRIRVRDLRSWVSRSQIQGLQISRSRVGTLEIPHCGPFLDAYFEVSEGPEIQALEVLV